MKLLIRFETGDGSSGSIFVEVHGVESWADQVARGVEGISRVLARTGKLNTTTWTVTEHKGGRR